VRETVALPKLSLNEGSLLRRTLLHVATFLVGSIAFVSLMSFLLVSVARGLGPHAPGSDSAKADAEDGDSPSKPAVATTKTGTPGGKTGINKRKVSPTTAERPKDE
jgi:hypothetical protein